MRRFYKKIPFLALNALLASSHAYAGTVFKCSNKGIPIYSESTCGPNAIQVILPKDNTHSAMLVFGNEGVMSLNVQMNGKTLPMIFDTGAETVTIPESMAKSLGVKGKTEKNFTSANGPLVGYVGKIDSLSVSGILFKDVEVSVLPRLATPLLGMNIIKKLNIVQVANKGIWIRRAD